RRRFQQARRRQRFLLPNPGGKFLEKMKDSHFLLILTPYNKAIPNRKAMRIHEKNEGYKKLGVCFYKTESGGSDRLGRDSCRRRFLSGCVCFVGRPGSVPQPDPFRFLQYRADCGGRRTSADYQRGRGFSGGFKAR